jgi:hypothetical protein
MQKYTLSPWCISSKSALRRQRLAERYHPAGSCCCLPTNTATADRRRGHVDPGPCQHRVVQGGEEGVLGSDTPVPSAADRRRGCRRGAVGLSPTRGPLRPHLCVWTATLEHALLHKCKCQPSLEIGPVAHDRYNCSSNAQYLLPFLNANPCWSQPKIQTLAYFYESEYRHVSNLISFDARHNDHLW